MDAIAFGWQIDERLSGVSENECKTIVPQLKNNGLIILKHGCKNDSIDYRDYMLPLALESDWKQQTSNNRTQNVINALKIINEIIKFGGTIATIANMVIR